MPKITLLMFLLLVCCHSAKAWEDPNKKKKYRIALHITNPASAMTKYGGAFEERNGKVAYVFSYIKYVSAYAGKQFGYEIDKYFRSKNTKEYYMYFRGTIGSATFDSKKLAIYGEKTDIVIPDVGYTGIAGGFGRRYNFTAFFIRWNLGLKYCPLLDDLDDPEKNMFRLFHATGPGAIIELNLRLGIQL